MMIFDHGGRQKGGVQRWPRTGHTQGEHDQRVCQMVIFDHRGLQMGPKADLAIYEQPLILKATYINIGIISVADKAVVKTSSDKIIIYCFCFPQVFKKGT